MNQEEPKLKSRTTVTEQFIDPVEEIYREYEQDGDGSEDEPEERKVDAQDE